MNTKKRTFLFCADNKDKPLWYNWIVSLVQKRCIPCEGGMPPLPEDEENKLLDQVPGWHIIRDATHKLRREFKFKNFNKAIDFVNKVAQVANQEAHHPDIYIFYNKVQLDLFTHAVGGLSENDFIMASKINAIDL